jgi:AraC-like DNA-binding protein
MDLLTDLLQQAGLRRRLLDLRALAPTTPLRFPCERSIGLHVVTQGQAFLHAPSAPGVLALGRGDIAVMARGSNHVLSLQPQHGAAEAASEASALASHWTSQQGAPVSAGSTVVISGAYQLWNTPVHPFFAQMPDWFVLRADTLPQLGPLALTLGLLQQELQQQAQQQHELGADTVVHGLLDVIFTYVLRAVVERQGLQQPGWSQALRDPPVRQAVQLMHDDCAHPWTLDELAARVGLSRTVLAERFRLAMADTPLNYLRTVRMQKALSLLSETPHALEKLAAEVGYQDAFSFSKVFKRVVGVSPKEFRRRDAQERTLAWRMGA